MLVDCMIFRKFHKSVGLQKQLLDARNDLVVAKDEQVSYGTAVVTEVKDEVKGYSAAVEEFFRFVWGKKLVKCCKCWARNQNLRPSV